MNPQVREYMIHARVLFVKDGCPECAKWKEFIERANLLVPINKRIRIINCTNIEKLNILDYPIFKVYDKKMIGNYPFLFFGIINLNGANTKEECEAFIMGAFHKDLIIPRENKYLFNKSCKYVKKGIFGKKRLICGDEDE